MLEKKEAVEKKEADPFIGVAIKDEGVKAEKPEHKILQGKVRVMMNESALTVTFEYQTLPMEKQLKEPMLVELGRYYNSKAHCHQSRQMLVHELWLFYCHQNDNPNRSKNDNIHIIDGATGYRSMSKDPSKAKATKRQSTCNRDWVQLTTILCAQGTNMLHLCIYYWKSYGEGRNRENYFLNCASF